MLVALLRAQAWAEPALEVELGGYLQAEAVVVDQSSSDQLAPASGEPLNQERALVRRARLRARAARGIAAGLIELDGNTVRGAAARIIAADVTVRWPARGEPRVAGTLGLMKIPFGADLQLEPSKRLFLEPATVARALFPGERDLGLRVQGGWRYLRWQLAAMNGEPIGSRTLPARDPNAGKDLVGRVGVDALLGEDVRVRAGVSGLRGRGFHPGTPGSKDVLVWRDTNENGVVEVPELQVQAGVAATPSESFDRFALGADAAVEVEIRCVGTLALGGELMWAENLDRGVVPADPVAAGRDVRELGWSLWATQELWPNALVGVRYDRYDPDADALEQAGAVVVARDLSLSTLALVAAWTYHDFARVTLEYDHNDNTLGRTVAGEPARMADDALTLRAQVVF